MNKKKLRDWFLPRNWLVPSQWTNKKPLDWYLPQSLAGKIFVLIVLVGTLLATFILGDRCLLWVVSLGALPALVIVEIVFHHRSVHKGLPLPEVSIVPRIVLCAMSLIIIVVWITPFEVLARFLC